MAGRDSLPGETDPFGGLRDSRAYHSRIVRGQIDTSNPEEGSTKVRTLEIISARDITAPVLWLSAKKRKSAWGRYMPMGGELIHVAYRNDDSAIILGYDATATKDGSAGWSVLKESQEQGVVGIATFRKLKGGEFDFKSSGDAYIFGSNMGTLLLAGGQAFIKLDKQAYRIESKALESHFTSETSEMRVGTVFRKTQPVSQSETAVLQGIYKEFLVDLNTMLPTGTPALQSKAKIHFGDILQPIINTPEISIETGAPLRGRISIGDAANVSQVFKLEIDNLGNVVWVQSPTGVLGLKMRANIFDMDATLNARFNGTTITLGKVGATEPLVCGNLLVTALTSFIQQVFVANSAAWGVGNLGSPVPLTPTVIASINAWLASFVSNQFFNSTKAFTEKV